MDDMLALEGGAAATQWQKRHAALQRRKLQKQHRAEARANKAKLLREAKADLKRRKQKWWANWKKRAAEAKAAGLPRPSRAGQPWQLGLNNPQVIDMTGRTFGRLTVIRSAPVSLTGRTSQKCRVWVVKCSCGSPERMVNGTSLRQGNSRSCGCLVRERLQKHFAKMKEERERLEAAPLSIRIDHLRHKILHRKRITGRDAKLLGIVRKELVKAELQQGIRRQYSDGRPTLLRAAGVRSVGSNKRVLN